MQTNRSNVRVSRGLLGAVILLGSVLAGCSSHYRVTDLSNGTVYYTNEVDSGKAGAAVFTDARTRARVTLQNPEVAQISDKEFTTAVGAR